MRILIYGKIHEDVVLHRLTGDVKINDETGILRSKQCDCLKFIEILKNLQFQFQQRYKNMIDGYTFGADKIL